MSDLPIKTTLKAGTGFDAPWVTVDANDPNDLAFKLKGLIEHESALTLVIEAANALKAHNNGAPIEAPQAAPAPFEQPVNPNSPPAWGQTPAAQQQGAAPAQQAPVRSKYAGNPHPEGKTCEVCPNVLEYKKSQAGKAKWQCGEWRWNGGNPNNHTVEWID